MSDTISEGERARRIEKSLRIVRVGHGANCSSVGSVVDTLFVSAVVGGAIFAAVAAAMTKEKVTEVKRTPPRESAIDDEHAKKEDGA